MSTFVKLGKCVCVLVQTAACRLCLITFFMTDGGFQHDSYMDYNLAG